MDWQWLLVSGFSVQRNQVYQTMFLTSNQIQQQISKHITAKSPNTNTIQSEAEDYPLFLIG